MLQLLLVICFSASVIYATEEKESLVTPPTIYMGIDINNAWKFLSQYEHSQDTHLIPLRQKAYETILDDLTNDNDLLFDRKLDKKLSLCPNNSEITAVIHTKIDEYLAKKQISPALKKTIGDKLKNDHLIRNRIRKTENCYFCGNACIGGMCTLSVVASIFLCIHGC